MRIIVDVSTGEQTVDPDFVQEPGVEPVFPVRRVSRRQFKMQLELAGLIEAVESWVASQDRLVQIAYADSGSFVRDEPMMEAGFTALSFSEAEIDAFFEAAGAL